MKRTVEEKVNYNKQRKGLFSSGYVLGVSLYEDYSKSDDEMKKMTKSIIDNSKINARNGDEFGKGIMSGYRDKANERKERLKK